MGKTLLQPISQKTNSESEVERVDDHSSLQELAEDMRPFLDLAAQQLLKPDDEVVSKLLQKISG